MDGLDPKAQETLDLACDLIVKNIKEYYSTHQQPIRLSIAMASHAMRLSRAKVPWHVAEEALEAMGVQYVLSTKNRRYAFPPDLALSREDMIEQVLSMEL